MTISIPQAPEAGLKLVRKNILFAKVTSSFELARRRPPRTFKSHPIYTASVDGLLKKQFLATSRLTGWQYIVRDGTEPICLAEVASNRSNRPHGLAYSARYPREYTQKTLDAMDAAQVSLVHSEKDYELRILRAPELLLQAVWIHAKDDDILFPILPVPVDIESNVPISAAKLAEKLLPFAEQRAAADDRG